MAIGIFHLCVPCSKLFGGDCLRTHKSSGSKVYQGHDTSENCNPVVQNDLTLSFLGLYFQFIVFVRPLLTSQCRSGMWNTMAELSFCLFLSVVISHRL